MDLTWLTGDTILVFLLVLLRITGMTVTAPMFSQAGVPVQLQVGIAVTMAFIMFPLYAKQAVIGAHTLPDFVWIGTQEVCIGLLIGFAANLMFSGIQMAGNHVTTQMGIGVASALDPISNEQSPVMGQFYFILAIFIFMSLNMHHSLILAIAKSFEVLPIAGGIPVLPELTARFMSMATEIFVFSIMLIFPLFGMMLVTEIALAFTSKLMPQMNIFMVALPLKVGVALLLVLLTLPFSADVLVKAFSDLDRHLMVLFRAAA